jgi:hypothetical protein
MLGQERDRVQTTECDGGIVDGILTAADFYNMANRLYFLIDFLRMTAREMNRVGETNGWEF